MLLIYAFTDAHGTWHGDPDADICAPQAGHGALTLPPPEQTDDGAGLFAGQMLRVWYATTDLEPSTTTYQLDSGEMLLASRHVHKLLSASYQTPPDGYPAESALPPPVSPAKLEIYATDHRYGLDAELIGNQRIEVNIIIITADSGEILGDLSGEIDVTDLAPLSRLLAAAADTRPPRPSPAPAPSVKPVHRGTPWTQELLQRLRAAHSEGKDAAELAAEFGRGEAAIRWKLYDLRLGPFPDDLVPEQRAGTVPEQPKAYTAEEKRQTHPNAYKKWQLEDEQRLARRSAEGATFAELSQELGRDEGAVISRLNKIGASGPAADEAARHTY
ncbi:hypothetical protein ACFQ7F_24865 [Streptomyces sp. NPDC056486]|uniref:hypothetical protein n=1 Tax=Streptomyces sp. NPDC056486 TaxID=3345835 RepID=UPI0036B34AC7